MTDFLDVSPTVRGLPKKHHNSTLKNYDWSLQPGGKEGQIRTYLEDMHDFINGELLDAPNLFLFGDVGTGKTHLSVALYRWCVLRTDAGVSQWLHVPSFVEEVKESYEYDGPGPMKRIEGAEVFIALDDLFGVDLSGHDKTILSRIIDIGHRNGASLVSTTNLNEQEVQAQLRTHEVSRLLANGTPMKFTGEDQRL